MKYSNHPWELIYKKEGRKYTTLLPAFDEFLAEFTRCGCLKVLDLGCGNGRHTVALAQRGFEVTGLDISLSGLAVTHQWLGESGICAKLLCADIRQSLPLSSEYFDAVLSTQVIHHAMLSEVRTAISEIWRVLNPGGIAFISVAGRNEGEGLSNQIEPGTVIPHEGPEKGLPHHLFTEREAKIEFSKFNIKEISSRDEGRVIALWLEKDK